MPRVSSAAIAALSLRVACLTLLETSAVRHALGDDGGIRPPDELSRLAAQIADLPPGVALAAELESRLRASKHFVTDLCANQSLHLLNNLGEPWAKQMVDSIGKPGSGILYGNVRWPGSFDECVSARNSRDDSVTADGLIVGKYCAASIPVNVTSAQVTVSMVIGLCVPGGCNANDTTALLQTALHMARLDGLQASVECQQQSRILDQPALAAIGICAAFAVMLLTATVYDVVLKSRTTATDSALFEVHTGSDGNDTPVAALNELPSTAAQREVIDERSSLLDARTSRAHSSYAASAPLSAVHSPSAGRLAAIIVCFSLYNNVRTLLRTSKAADGRRHLTSSTTSGNPKPPRLSFLDGIRFFTICWVMLGHVYSYAIDSADVVYFVLTNRLASWPSQAVLNATFSTDTFFFLSGLLVSYILLNEMCNRDKGLGFGQWLYLYIHRYIRLTPAYAVVLMIWSCLAVYISDGPFWPRSKQFNTACANNWWANLAYVNNFWGMEAQCMNWTWYLANDMQFFLLAPPLLWLTHRRRRVGVCVLFLLTIASSITSAIITATKHLFIDNIGLPLRSIQSQEAAAESYLSFFEYYYAKPWCRFHAYGIGMLVAVMLRWYAQLDSKNVPRFYLLGWLVAAGCCLSVVYAPFDVEVGNRSVSSAEAALYNGLGRLAWCIALGWLTWACYAGHAGWIARFLSWAPFGPLARLAYCAYLIHPIIISILAAASRTLISFDSITVAYLFVGTVGLSFAAAFVCSVAFEMPIAAMERLFSTTQER